MPDTPNYRDILIRLADKVRRNSIGYRRIARQLAMKSQNTELTDTESLVLSGQSSSLNRCADDAEFTFARAIERITVDDVADILKLGNPAT